MPAGERLPPLTRPAPATAQRWWTRHGDRLSDATATELLLHGDVEVRGRLVSASNATLYAMVRHDGLQAAAVYKPRSGERPLWDFPHGSLAGREVAAYEVSVAGGFDVVPPTVLRDGPFGEGSLQLWVEPEASAGAAEADEGRQPADRRAQDDAGSEHVPAGETAAGLVDIVHRDEVPAGWVSVLEAYGPDGEPVSLVHAADPRLATVAAFDVVVNNADRKAGHLLAASGDRVVGVDHGLTFHTEPKLRTVLWGFGGRPAAGPDLARTRALADWLDSAASAVLGGLLTRRERTALQQRVLDLLQDPVLPLPDETRHVIPWPPF